MAISVFWQNPPGNDLYTLQFIPGQPMHLSVHVTDMLGGPAQVNVTVDIRHVSGEDFAPIGLDGGTNWWTGNVDWDFMIPDAIAVAKATFVVDDGTDSFIENIGFGTEPPPPPTGSDWTKYLIWGAIGVGALVVVTQLVKRRI